MTPAELRSASSQEVDPQINQVRKVIGLRGFAKIAMGKVRAKRAA